MQKGVVEVPAREAMVTLLRTHQDLGSKRIYHVVDSKLD